MTDLPLHCDQHPLHLLFFHVSWWNQYQPSIEQLETPLLAFCSKLPLQSFLSPPQKPSYRSRSKECESSQPWLIVSLGHAYHAGFSWCGHGFANQTEGHLWQHWKLDCWPWFCWSTTGGLKFLRPKLQGFQTPHLTQDCSGLPLLVCSVGWCDWGGEPARHRIILRPYRLPQNFQTTLVLSNRSYNHQNGHCC